MNYQYKPYQNSISDSELIADLVAVCERMGKDSLSMAEYDAWGKYNSSTISRRFGTWNTALKGAKIEARNSFHSEVDLLLNIENVWQSKGKQPSRRDMDNHPSSTISSGAYLRRFGKWSTALDAFMRYINQDTNNSQVERVDTEQVIKHCTGRDVNLRLRFHVLQRDNFTCCICGASPAKDGGKTKLHVDHVLPWAKGGETVLQNLQTLCSECNLGKGDISL